MQTNNSSKVPVNNILIISQSSRQHNVVQYVHMKKKNGTMGTLYNEAYSSTDLILGALDGLWPFYTERYSLTIIRNVSLCD